MPRKIPFRYEYVVGTRVYKKGMSNDCIRCTSLSGESVRFNLDVLKAMTHAKSRIGNKLLASRRLLVHEETIYSSYNGLSVGTSTRDGVDTPFNCVRQRIQEAS